MNRQGVLALAAMWTYACGDGATEPLPSPPDPPRPTTVTVSPATASLTALGATVQLSAQVLDQNGQVMAGTTVTWASNATAVATVSAAGLVTAVGNGTATITATAGSASGAAGITVENPDRAALVALYNATDGPNWVNNENWLTDAPLGEWYGVRTDGSGRVRSLILRGTQQGPRRLPHGLSGAIPPEIGDLTNLTWLSLELNELSGPIPPGIGNIASLTYLDLGANRLTGPIPPELAKLANLTSLFLDANSLAGPIPAELGSLGNLEQLGLGLNNLTGPIPIELANLSNLVQLSIGGNELAGPIPAELASLHNLTLLFLVDNRLEGPIPPELGNLTGLTRIRIDGNRLTGSVPQSFLRLEHLEVFWMAGNATLCVPGTSAFLAWWRGIERTDPGGSSFCNSGDLEVLESLYASTGGADWTSSAGWLSDGAVEDWYGVAADSLGHVVTLDLAQNGLGGKLPLHLGDLARTTELRIGGNALSGPLPASLAQMPLQVFHYADTDLCVPPGGTFRAWLNGIPSHQGTGDDCAPLSARDILATLYASTGGPNWVNSENWLSDAPLKDWYGVEVDDQGRVVELSFFDNGLTGRVPLEIGGLANLQLLSLGGNRLTGPIPPALGDLSSLTELGLQSNEFSGSIPPELATLTNLTRLSIGSNKLSGPIPSGLGNLTNLRSLHLSFNDLTGPVPPEFGDLVNLTRLAAQGMGLTGSIPPELGRLVNLRELLLGFNELTGAIPPDLADLPELRWLDLWGNALTGPIPPELGRLSKLERLFLTGNELSGSLPPQLGNLANLQRLALSDNHLSGGIPVELGNLVRLTELTLNHNAFAGALPNELGNLRNLVSLNIAHNELSGPVATGFAGLSSLQELSFTNNSAMSGPLPAGLTALDHLDVLLAGGTGLCAPADPGFQTWLQGVRQRRIALCREEDAPVAYLTQAVQSREFPVPLVAGERALLRVFPTANRSTSQGIPAVRARFYRDGVETHVVDIPGKSAAIPTEVDESRLANSANAEIPDYVVQPGLEMVIQVDPDGTVDPALGVPKRIPEAGRLAVEVKAMPLFDLTLIPFIWSQTQDSSIVDLVEAMAADPVNHAMLADTRTLLPVGQLDVTAHEPVLSSSNSAYALLSQTIAIRAMEGGTGHYMGMMSPPVTAAAGVARRPGRSSFSTPSAFTIAHELGHNLSLHHAPCGSADGPDPSFPYSDGSIGAWGYDFRDGGSLIQKSKPDLMSYCRPPWISDYSFTNALRFRLSDADSVGLPMPPATGARALLLWGGQRADSVPFLEPAFLVDAPPALPQSGGDYRLAGHTADGSELFSLAFAMPEVADGDGSSTFAFVISVRAGWEGNLASISLTGPGGSFMLDGESDAPMTILRNPASGQVRGILRDLPPATQAAMDAVGQGFGSRLEMLFSRGIPEADAWRQ